MADNTELVNNLVEYYQDLLILQYRSKPKARATIELFVRQLLQDGIYFDVENAFDVNTAVGKQLDMLGKYIGVDRYYKGQTFPDGYFGFVTTSAPDSAGQKGFCLTSTFTDDLGQCLLSSEVISNTQQLPDDLYRIILRFQIVCNSINMSQGSIDNALFEYFGLQVIFSSMNNMTIGYFLDSSLGVLVEVLKQKKVLPKPLGVKLEYIITKSKPFYGFVLSSNPCACILKTGFALSSNFLTKSGKFLISDEIFL